jgi:2-chlorobenzoate 1,2-dioxygenase
MMQSELRDLGRLVEPDRVHRSVYTDPAIFEREMATIFHKVWIYVGHESQVQKPGDYVRTFIGRKPVVLVRTSEAEDDGASRQ